MANQVIADIEIEDQRIDYYSSVFIRQRFSAHHEFTIRIPFDVLGRSDTFTMDKAEKMIGKTAIIKFKGLTTFELYYEFRGIVCEISLEQADNFSSDLVVKGYSPTILLENGPNLKSFENVTLNDVVEEVCAPVKQVSCQVAAASDNAKNITYICQYRESSFHFVNRLAADFGQCFYYDGKELIFGIPRTNKEVKITYGEDLHNMQMTLRILPLTFSSYSYSSKEDDLFTSKATDKVDGLDQYGSYALKESHTVFSDAVSFPIKPRVASQKELQQLVDRRKATLATNLQVLSGSSDSPTIAIGSVAVVNLSVYESSGFRTSEYGKYLITGIEHHLSDNGVYHNTFDAIPSGINCVPAPNVVQPIAEPQIATVTDNNDPDTLGRVKVQMLWQQADSLQTDWIRVMTPDAGGGKDGAKNRGMVCIPEVGDQVMVHFRYNDPDRPFVMGSMFHGKTGGGGGSGNKTKSLTALSGSTITLEGDAISIIDAKTNSIVFSGDGKIDVKSSSSISLKCGSAEITMNSSGKIEIKGTEVIISGSTKAVMKSTADFTAEGTKATVHGTNTEVTGDAAVDIKSDGKAGMSSPATTVEGKANLKLNSPGIVDIEGTGMTNVKGGIVNLN